MARLNINVGTNANDSTGDDLRTAMQKINTNFIEVYGTTAEANDLVEDLSPQLGGDLDVNGYIITSASNGNISIVPNGTGLLTLGALKVNGTTVSADDSTKITLAESVDITGVLQVNEISSADSSNIHINDGLNVSGTLTANSFVTNTIISSESTAVEVADGLTVAGTLTANTFITNAISSSESSAIQINDSVNISGTLTAAGGITGLTILTRAAISDGVASTATSSQTSIDTTAAATYRSVQYYLSVSDPTNLNYALYNILITHDGTLAYISSNLVSSTGVDLGDFNADISGGNVRLLVTPATSDTVNYTFVKTAIVV